MCVNLNQMLHSNVFDPKTNLYSLMWAPYIRTMSSTVHISVHMEWSDGPWVYVCFLIDLDDSELTVMVLLGFLRRIKIGALINFW